jgi:hypothetical protein
MLLIDPAVHVAEPKIQPTLAAIEAAGPSPLALLLPVYSTKTTA